MDASDTRRIMKALAAGLDPLTGDSLPQESPLHHPLVSGALVAVAEMLEPHAAGAVAAHDAPSEHRFAAAYDSIPSRADEPWPRDEDQKLRDSFYAGIPFWQIAEMHQRPREAIFARLVGMGCIKKRSALHVEPEEQPPESNSRTVLDPEFQWWRTKCPRAGQR